MDNSKSARFLINEDSELFGIELLASSDKELALVAQALQEIIKPEYLALIQELLPN